MIVTIMIAAGGIQYASAGGDPQKVHPGHLDEAQILEVTGLTAPVAVGPNRA